MRYNEGNNCVTGCTNDYAYPIDSTNFNCDNSCMFYITNNIKYCTESCEEP